MTPADHERLDALLLRAREAGVGAMLHPLLLLYYTEMGPAELSRRTGVSTAGMTGLLDRAEKEGWVERFDYPGDIRRRPARLTEKGHEVAEKVFGKWED